MNGTNFNAIAVWGAKNGVLKKREKEKEANNNKKSAEMLHRPSVQLALRNDEKCFLILFSYLYVCVCHSLLRCSHQGHSTQHFHSGSATLHAFWFWKVQIYILINLWVFGLSFMQKWWRKFMDRKIKLQAGCFIVCWYVLAGISVTVRCWNAMQWHQTRTCWLLSQINATNSVYGGV